MMKRRRLAIVLIVLSLFPALAPLGASTAQGPQVPSPWLDDPPLIGPKGPQSPWHESREYNGPGPDSGRPQPQIDAASLLGSGGPDDYGYTWDDGVAFGWIDATRGTKSTLNGDDQFAGPVGIGFPFVYYEHTYHQLFFNTNGLITFGEGSQAYSNMRIPVPAPPNDLIAAFWDDLCVDYGDYNSGSVYYLRGGSAPNRYFVIEWHNVSRLGSQDLLTFQVVLHESGDVVVQYLSLSGYLYSSTVGVEDDVGFDGLQYSGELRNGLAVRFYRPSAAARVKTWPLYHGGLTRAGGQVVFEQPIRNSGELGTDTYDLTVSSPWPLALYAADGATPLTDTDSDGMADTGPVVQGNTVLVTVKVTIPVWAGVGDHNLATVSIHSSLDASKQETATFRTAVPAPFAQALRDDANGAMSLYLVHPSASVLHKATLDGHWGYDMAVAEAPNGNLFYAWTKGRSADSAWVGEIEYTLVDADGATARAVSKLTDHSAATLSTYDYTLAVAGAPDGRIGVLWYREVYEYTAGSSRYLYNMYFAILDPSGALVHGPQNLTNNDSWYQWDPPTYDVPRFFDPTIAATTDNRFVLAWRREHQARPDTGCSSSCWVDDVYYAVRSTTGAAILGARQLTSDTPGYADSHYDPNLATLSGNRVLLSWTRGGDYGDIYYSVLTSYGGTVRGMTNLVEDGTSQWDWGSDAVQLPDGSTVIAWTGGWYPHYSIRFAVLDAGYDRLAGPTLLSNPAALWGNAYVSVAQADDQAVLTWMDYDWDYRPHLYYALVDGGGTQVTPPTIFYTSEAISPRVLSSYYGLGNTSRSTAAEFSVFLPAIIKRYPPLWCDAYESNDHYWDAYGPLVFGQSYLAYLCENDVADWYYIDIDAGSPVTIDLAVPAVADYDLYLYRQGDWWNAVAESASFGYGMGERIVYTPTTVGRYYLRVQPYAGHSDTHPYVLEVRR